MKELNGIWWTINQEKVPGKLVITDENKIFLTTFKKLIETNIICGFAEGKQITLVDTELDRTDIYKSKIQKNKIEIDDKEEKLDIEYSTYKYTADIIIFGHVYERKGDIRLIKLSLDFTNLDKWVDFKTKNPEIAEKGESILLKIDKINQKVVKTNKFDFIIRNPYTLARSEYEIQITNKTEIAIENIINEYLQTIRAIIQCIQFFLILCTGDNINVEKIKATDSYNREIEMIFGYGKSNYENRSILKNIIKYKDIENNIENIINKWIEIYEENEMLIVNFTKLQTTEDLIINEYINLMSAIDSLYLMITGKEQTKEHFAEIVKKLLRETNFILNLSDNEIEELAIKVKNIRRYFVHSNKTQKEVVHSNIPIIQTIISMLIECIRARIMLEMGIDKDILEKYYSNIENLKHVKYDIVNNINVDDKVPNESIKEGRKIVNQLSKNERENIAELNGIMGTRYRESPYDLENSNDLIQIVQNTTAEYMDYSHYWAELESIIENFDQSIEVFHPEKWFNMTMEGKTKDNLIDETILSLSYTSDCMYDLLIEAEEKCKELWEYLLLGNNEKAKKYFVGDIKKYSNEQLIDALEYVIENIYDTKYRNQVESDAKEFGKSIKKYLNTNIEQ